MLIRHGGQGWVEAEPSGFADEVEFQDLVQETFDQVLATQSDAPALIAREVVMPDGGKLDVLGIDTDGVISVCECKLASNAGARREVLGQVLEYAASLNGMSFREFRRRVEARLDGELSDLMEAIAPEDWDREVWTDEVSAHLDAGEFRVVIAVDDITPTLKGTVLYLNSHTDLPVFAVGMQRARDGDTEVLVPTLFAEEQARRKAPSPSTTSTVEDADTVVVAATYALRDYEETGHYICQPNRSFRDGVEYLGFYGNRRIEPHFPRILARRPNITFSATTAASLETSSDSIDQQIAAVIRHELENHVESRRIPGEPYQVVLLDPEGGFELEQPIRHEGGSAWLRGQRYSSAQALKTQPGTTEELRAAGG